MEGRHKSTFPKQFHVFEEADVAMALVLLEFSTSTQNYPGMSLFLDCVMRLDTKSHAIRAELHANDPEVGGVARISGQGPMIFPHTSIYEEPSTVNRPNLQCLL